MALRIESMARDAKDIALARKLYRRSFPRNERMPFWMLRWKLKSEHVDLLGFYDLEAFAGFAYLVTFENKTIILFFAIESGLRSRGYGGMALEAMRARYPEHCFVVGVEAVERTASNYAQRLRRKAFYTRNGYVGLPFVFKEFGVRFEALSTGADVTVEDYKRIMRAFTGKRLYPLYERNVTFEMRQ